MELSLEEKIKEYQNWVLSHGKTPPKKEKIKFSDGRDMRSWAHNWRRYVKTFLKEHPKEPLPENLLQIENMCERIETLSEGKIQLAAQCESMPSRIAQYLEKTRELGRRPLEKDHLCFRDGRDMVGWYHASNSLYGNGYTEDRLLTENESNLSPFMRMKKQLHKEGYYGTQSWKLIPLTFDKRVEYYLNYFRTYRRHPRPEERFSDGVKMEYWYHNQEVLIRDEFRSHAVVSEERMKEIAIFAWMENEMLKVKDVPSIRKPRMSYEEKVQYFVEIVDKEAFCANRSLFQFPDGTSVSNFVSAHMAIFDEYLIHLSFEDRILEYLKMARENGKKLNTRDPRKFSDGRRAASWLLSQETGVRKEKKEGKFVSNLRMSELYVLALLDDYLYTLDHVSSFQSKQDLDETPWVKRIKTSH